MSRPDDPSNAADTPPWAQAKAPARDLTGKALGDFQVERLLGRGGMGEVYLARQVSLNRPVALKVLRPDLLTKPTYLSRFEAEATAVAKLNHPNIVHIYTLGDVDGVRFLAMEYVQGTNLREFLRKKGALDYPLAFSVIRQAGVAIAAAGEHGLIHRDLKPENLLMTKKGQVKVADFGLCRDLDAGDVSLTQTGITMGTPLYMSPEQAQGHAVDHRSDLYSLGVTFYHMIAGVPPFKADAPLALALKHVRDTPASLSVHRPDVPPELDRLVQKLMAKAPGDRYQSAGEMLRDLARIRGSMNAPSGPQPQAPAPAPAPASPAESPSGAVASAASALRVLFTPAESAASAPAPAPGRFGPGARLGLVAAAVGLGALAGFLNRPEDLLAATAPAPRQPPGLWIAPRWAEVERQGSAEGQYLDALVRAPREAQAAAWLAVPGHFPESREWSSRAYAQLGRLLLRRLDAGGLTVLAEELEHWGGGQTRDKDLARALRAGVDALRGDLDGVLAHFEGPLAPARLTDPATLELCLEAVDRADRAASGPGAPASPALALRKLRGVREALGAKFVRAEGPAPAPAPAAPAAVRPGPR